MNHLAVVGDTMAPRPGLYLRLKEMEELPIVTSREVPPGAVYVGPPKSFQMAHDARFIVMLHPDTEVDDTLHQKIEDAYGLLHNLTLY